MHSDDSSQLRWDQIPETDVEKEPVFTKDRVSRRALGRGAVVAAGGAALGVLGGAVGRLPKPAGAVVGTEHLDCADYGGWEGYDDKSTQAPCVGATYGSQYCGSDGWFLVQTVGSWSSAPVKACGENVTKKNAWRWNYSGTEYRCADGIQGYSGYTVFRICSRSNP